MSFAVSTSGSSNLLILAVMFKYFFLSHLFMWSNVEKRVCDASHFKSWPAVIAAFDSSKSCDDVDDDDEALLCVGFDVVEVILRTASNSFMISVRSDSLPSQTA